MSDLSNQEAFLLNRIQELKEQVDSESHNSDDILAKLKDLETLYGEYDLLMKIQVETMDDLDKKHGGSEQIRLRCTP